MPDFRPQRGTTTTAYKLRKPIADIHAFDAIIRSLVYDNPLHCTRYACHPEEGPFPGP